MSRPHFLFLSNHWNTHTKKWIKLDQNIWENRFFLRTKFTNYTLKSWIRFITSRNFTVPRSFDLFRKHPSFFRVPHHRWYFKRLPCFVILTTYWRCYLKIILFNFWRNDCMFRVANYSSFIQKTYFCLELWINVLYNFILAKFLRFTLLKIQYFLLSYRILCIFYFLKYSKCGISTANFFL